MRKSKNKRVIPGFGLSFGITITMLGLIVIIPLCSLVVFSAKLSFPEFLDTITRPRVLSSYAVSFFTAFVAAAIDAVMGMIIAWVLVRYDFPGKAIMDGIIELPFALPTAVAGIALTHLTTTEGWVGAFFQKFGIKIAYTRLGIIENILGANSRQTMFRVILPEILPSLIAGFTMSFARGLGEYGSVVFIAGNTPYETEIAPLMIMSKLQEFDYASATSIALVMLAAAFVILFINAWLQSRASKIVSGIA